MKTGFAQRCFHCMCYAHNENLVIIPEYFIRGIVGSQKVELAKGEDTSNKSLIDPTNPLPMFLENYFQSIEPEKEKLEKSRSEYRATLKYLQ